MLPLIARFTSHSVVNYGRAVSPGLILIARIIQPSRGDDITLAEECIRGIRPTASNSRLFRRGAEFMGTFCPSCDLSYGTRAVFLETVKRGHFASNREPPSILSDT